MTTSKAVYGTCADAIREQFNWTTPNTGGWQDRHLRAWSHPARGGELRTVRMLQALATYADEHRLAQGCEDAKLGEDGYAAPYWLDMARATLKLLSMDVGRLDAGTLDTLLRDMVRAAGFDEQDADSL